MSEFEVPQPIICSPFEEPAKHWHLEEGTAPTEPTPGRRPAHYFYRAPGEVTEEGAPTGTAVPLPLVNVIRERLKEWRKLLDAEPVKARQIIRKLLQGRLVFAPDPKQRIYTFSGMGSYGALLTGVVQKVWCPRGDSNTRHAV